MNRIPRIANQISFEFMGNGCGSSSHSTHSSPLPGCANTIKSDKRKKDSKYILKMFFIFVDFQAVNIVIIF
jgi:hypothetical protein